MGGGMEPVHRNVVIKPRLFVVWEFQLSSELQFINIECKSTSDVVLGWLSYKQPKF